MLNLVSSQNIVFFVVVEKKLNIVYCSLRGLNQICDFSGENKFLKIEDQNNSFQYILVFLFVKMLYRLCQAKRAAKPLKFKKEQVVTSVRVFLCML